MSIQANRSNAISLQVGIEEYFRDNNLDEEITDYDFGNGAFTEWHFYCDGDDFKYIDDYILYDYIADLREFRDENFEVFSFRDEISVKILDDELNESKESARKSIKESSYFDLVKAKKEGYDDYKHRNVGNPYKKGTDLYDAYWFGVEKAENESSGKTHITFSDEEFDSIFGGKMCKKSIKESYLDEVTNLYFFDLDVDEECEVQLENFVMPCRISQFYKNDRYMYLIVQSKTSDETYFVITYNYKKNKFVSSKVFSSYREAKNQLVDTIAMGF